MPGADQFPSIRTQTQRRNGSGVRKHIVRALTCRFISLAQVILVRTRKLTTISIVEADVSIFMAGDDGAFYASACACRTTYSTFVFEGTTAGVKAQGAIEASGC